MIKNLVNYACIFTACALLQACANVLPSSINISQDKMQKKLEKQFPKDKNFLAIYHLNISNPKISLDAPNNRVKIIVDTKINSPFMPTAQGVLKFSSHLILDENKQNLLLQNPIVEEITFKDANANINNVVLPLFKVAASTILEGFPIYHIKNDELVFLGVKVQPTNITINPDSITIDITSTSVTK